MPLLDNSACRQLALRALATMTHHGGESIRVKIARTSSATLVRLIEEHPNDAKVAELATVTLAHSVSAVVNVGEPAPDPKVFQALDVPAIIRVLTENVRKPTASLYLLEHAVNSLPGFTLHCRKDCQAYPSMLRLLVATLRSSDMARRCTALEGLIRLHKLEAEKDQRIFDSIQAVARLQRDLPSHLSDVMTAYGPPRCETVLTLKTAALFQRAMMTCAQDHNLYALGLTLSQLILRTEFSISDGMFQAENPTTGQLEFVDVGLPFRTWSDALPHCARAIRDKGNPTEIDAADILDLKFFVMKQRLREAVEFAKKATQRNSDLAYFCYIVTLTADNAEGLRYAKKGMKCKNTTPFVHFQMMQRAVEHAAQMGLSTLQDSSSVRDRKWEEGIAFLTSAMEDSKTYIEQAPPDNRYMKNVSYWRILLTLALHGPELNVDLRELDVSFDILQWMPLSDMRNTSGCSQEAQGC